MNKRIVICADGTWNRPEKDLSKHIPTNVLRLARAISPTASDGVPQQVFYDWGVGSYYEALVAGALGVGLNKNIMDNYRYLVHNYQPGDELFLFGFSRGAYTVRSLCGLINNCGILKRADASLIETAFAHYQKSGRAYAPDGVQSVAFRKAHAHPSREVRFVGAWDTVGSLGIPFSFIGLLDKKDEFYDRKVGRNVTTARHALAIDEHRSDFEPTVWQSRTGTDLKQVWFAGAHSDIGGGYPPDKRTGGLLSDIPLAWMMTEATRAGLTFEPHLAGSLKGGVDATLHNSRRFLYRSKPMFYRPIDHGSGPVLLHDTVKQRWELDAKYRPRNLATYLDTHGWPQLEGSDSL